jgi:hypothetical protein
MLAVPTFPFLPMRCALTSLEPRIFKDLKCSEDKQQRSCSWRRANLRIQPKNARSDPGFCACDPGRSISKWVNEATATGRRHRVLWRIWREWRKELHDQADRGDQLHQSVNGVQANNHSLSNAISRSTRRKLLIQG